MTVEMAAPLTKFEMDTVNQVEIGGTVEELQEQLNRYDDDHPELQRFYQGFRGSLWNSVPADDTIENVKEAAKSVVELLLQSKEAAIKYQVDRHSPCPPFAHHFSRGFNGHPCFVGCHGACGRGPQW